MGNEDTAPNTGRSRREAAGFVPLGSPGAERRENGGHNQRGEAVSELMPWLSADAGKSKQIVTVPIFPIFYASPEPCLFDGLLDHRFMHNNSVGTYPGLTDTPKGD